MSKSRSDREKRRSESRLDVRASDPAVRELLDHVAEELAKEYVRLMKQTASDPRERED